LTVGFERVVLLVARTVTALTRLLDVVTLIETDHRIQVMFTTDPGGTATFRRGVDQFLAELGAATISWEHATATRFDLIVAASENDRLRQLTGPILLVPHGIGYQKYYPHGRVVAGMDPDRLVDDGTVVPTHIGVSHHDQTTQLAAFSPQAASRALVIGDPALARLHASRHRRDAYRTDLGATGRVVVLMASTWGPDSLLGRSPTLPRAVAEALPVDGYLVLAVVHPGVWAAHGAWQVRAWLTRAREAGVTVIRPDRWQSALVAADCVVSDQGSLALYAAALDLPLLLTEGNPAHTVAGSPLALLAEQAARIHQAADLRTQLDKARAAHRAGQWDDVVARAVVAPGTAATSLRAAVYRQLGVAEPSEPAEFPPALPPADPPDGPAVIVSGAVEHADLVTMRRFPAAGHGPPHPAMDYRHLVVEIARASVRQLAAATILVVPWDGLARFTRHADDLLTTWPDSLLVAAGVDPATCVVRSRENTITVRAADAPAGFDPLSLASLVFVRSRQGLLHNGPDRLLLTTEIVTDVLSVSA
jgi:hypothetical protein